MIYIESGDEVILPARFHKRHNICVDLYDMLVKVLKDDVFQQIHGTSLDNLSPTDLAFLNQEQSGEDVLRYLADHGRTDELRLVLSKHVLVHVLNDFCNFMHESLRASRDGKMAVSYNLLRKPLTDELLIFEQLLVDRDDFINKFYFQGDPSLYDPSPRSYSESALKGLIAAASGKVGMLGSFFNELVYDIRYNKQSLSGLNAMMNHAHHIVTTDRNYKTESRSLNFVFSVQEDFERYWSNYYTVVPYLLIYVTAIIDSLLAELIQVDKTPLAFRDLQRYLSILFMAENESSEKHEQEHDFVKIFGQQCGVTCECSHHNEFDVADLELYFNTGAFLCVKCLAILSGTSQFAEKLTNFFHGSDPDLPISAAN